VNEQNPAAGTVFWGSIWLRCGRISGCDRSGAALAFGEAELQKAPAAMSRRALVRAQCSLAGDQAE
jgi:hypothetical protein